MDKGLAMIGDILMAALGIASFVSSIILIRKTVKSDEFRDKKIIKNLKIGLNNLTYLRLNKGITISEKFIYGHRNTGDSPCELKELTIDASYLTKNSNVLMKKGGY